MQKIKVKKSVVEQMTGKLKTPENGNIKPHFAEKLQNTALKPAKKQITSKLRANEKESVGVTKDGNIYDLEDPTEKFYYDLKNELEKAENNDDIEKSAKNQLIKKLVHIHNSKGKDYFAERYVKVIEDKKKAEMKRKTEIAVRTKKYQSLVNMLKIYEDNLTDKEKKFVEKKKRTCKPKKGTYTNSVNKKTYTGKYYISTYRQKIQKEEDFAIFLASMGFSVYLVPEPSAGGKKIDAIVNNVPVDFKKIGTGNWAIPDEYAKGMKKENCKGVLMQVPKERSEYKYKNRKMDLKTFVENNTRKEDEPGVSKNGILALWIEDDDRFEVFDMKKIRAEHDSSAQGGTSNKSSIFNISQQNNLSSRNVTKSLTFSGHKLQGRIRLYGMDISIENKKGSYRSGTDKDGHKWKTLMHYDYGYIRGTVGTDKDHLDCYVGPDKKANKVYVIHQNDPVTHKYDEDKCMLCFSSAADAKAAYMKQYDRPGFYGSMTTMTIEQFKSFIFSHKGKMVHKSFDINITDITENNKQQKLEQFNKALNAIADNRPFMIKHIPVDASKNYGNLLVRITDFDKSKIEKAVHKVALSLNTDISGASKGESYVYEAQKELAEGFFKEFTDKTRAIYNFVISYFDLPDIRIVSKAGELKHKGKILYNPETGLPIKESDWKKFVVELEKYLNRNYSGIGEKIVLSSESLGIILDRLSKTNSLEAIRKMSLSSLKSKRYDVDWISESIKNMKDTFGEVISRERQARIQIACDSAAQRVTRVSDDIRNNIQQIIIDGIRDKQSKSVVAQNLFDKCASLNRDMQRIADSEVQMAANSAYIKEEVYNSKPDEKVYFKRFEMLDDNTCKKCRKLKGTIALWSEVPLPDERIKDEYAEYAIWDGKNEGDCPVGIVHPWCRGTWVRYYPEV